MESITISNLKENVEEKLLVDGCFIAVGILPNNKLVKDSLDLDEGGYIKAGEDGITSIPGVFAAGDVRTNNSVKSLLPPPTVQTVLLQFKIIYYSKCADLLNSYYDAINNCVNCMSQGTISDSAQRSCHTAQTP